MSTPTMPSPTAHRAEPRSPVAASRGPVGAVRRHPLVAFFVLAYAASWLAWLPYVLSGDGLGVLNFRFPKALGDSQIPGVLPGAYVGPLGAALVVSAITGGRDGLRRWRQRLFRMRVGGWYWYPIVLIGVPVLLVGGTMALPGAAESLRVPSSPSPPRTCPCSPSRC